VEETQRADQPPEPARRARPPLLVAVIAGVALEAGLMLGVAAYYVAGVTRQAATDAGAALGAAALIVALGAFLLVCAWALWRGRRWARGPVMTWQLLQILALATTGGLGTWWGWVVVLLAAAVAGGLLAPPVVRATTSKAEPPVT
jgi:hypothetical protein